MVSYFFDSMWSMVKRIAIYFMSVVISSTPSVRCSRLHTSPVLIPIGLPDEREVVVMQEGLKLGAVLCRKDSRCRLLCRSQESSGDRSQENRHRRGSCRQAPGCKAEGGRRSTLRCFKGMNCSGKSPRSRPKPHTQHPSISSVLASPYTIKVPLLPHFGQSAIPFQGAICFSRFCRITMQKEYHAWIAIPA